MKNDLNQLKSLIIDLNRFLKAHRILGRHLYDVNLAIEEPIVNIINHSRKDDAAISIRIEVKINPENISILITDDGNPFNPLSVPHMDIRKPALERSLGGLGMHIVRNIMQSMWYERKAGKNIFQIQIER